MLKYLKVPLGIQSHACLLEITCFLSLTTCLDSFNFIVMTLNLSFII